MPTVQRRQPRPALSNMKNKLFAFPLASLNMRTLTPICRMLKYKVIIFRKDAHRNNI